MDDITQPTIFLLLHIWAINTLLIQMHYLKYDLLSLQKKEKKRKKQASRFASKILNKYVMGLVSIQAHNKPAV